MIYPPTDEQVDAMRAVATGEHTAIEALAGTGKTSTLRLIAQTSPQRQISYVAFNRAIVLEAKGTMPTNVKPSTAHGLAFRAVGRDFAERLDGGHRMRSEDIAKKLGIRPLVLDTEHGRRPLAAGWLAGVVIRAMRRFSQTADLEPGAQHIPHLDGIDAEGEWDNTNTVAEYLAPSLGAAWADLCSPAGTLPYSPNYYLKLWQLSDPRIRADLILYDEAQDANEAMLAIVNAQDAQKVFVGDRYQQIYEWNGAVNAMSNVDVARRTYLTNSFRFGPEIAAYANRILEVLESESTLVGRGAPGRVEPLEDDSIDAYLARTNAGAVIRALRELEAGGRPAIVGGADEVVRFAKGALDLQANQMTMHPDLACFVSWNQVLAYVEDDQLGGDLKLLVSLIEDFGAQTIVNELSALPDEDDATIVISTAHKSKGRQWPRVQIADDYPDDGLADEEARLLYVAATRAERHLDASQVTIAPKTIGLGLPTTTEKGTTR